MKIEQIRIPYRWEDVNSEKDEIDVFIDTNEGYTYTVTLGTPKNYESSLEEDKYYLPYYEQVIFVKKLTKEIVEETIQVYAEKDEGYWLNFYSLPGKIHKTVFDQLQIKDIENQKKSDTLIMKNIDFLYLTVPVSSNEGYIFNLTLTTPKNLELLMDQKKMNYMEPGPFVILVKDFTKEIIEETVHAYIQENDGYRLKLYHFAGEIDKIIFDQLKAEHIQERKNFKELEKLYDFMENFEKLRKALNLKDETLEKDFHKLQESLNDLIKLKRTQFLTDEEDESENS